MSLLLEDARTRPELFAWYGAIRTDDLDQWLHKRELPIPQDLTALWRDTGGGDIFETETLLAPFGDPDKGDDVDGVNAMERSKGLPEGYLLFHTGLRQSAVRLSDGRYITFRPGSFEVEMEFPSLEAWYEGLIRNEYAARYGLTVARHRSPVGG
jgi:hypothetical protein